MTLFGATGNVTRVLDRNTIQNEKTLLSGVGAQVAFQASGANYFSIEVAKREAAYVRVVSAATGKVKAKRKFKNPASLIAVSGNGKTVVTVSKGKLQLVSMKTGKRTIVVSKGVMSAYMN